MTWNPDQYLRFSDQRRRPAIDLLAQVDLAAPKLIYDLGCGPGNVTHLLKQRWPEARVIGVDSSPEMLNKARATDASIEWIEADLAQWRPDAKADLVFSNATLQWIDHHQTLLPAIAAMVADDGMLALQLPRNQQSPTHVGMIEAIKAGPWAAKLQVFLERPLWVERPWNRSQGVPHWYWDSLRQSGFVADIWETEYLHVLAGDNAVVEWLKGSSLKPLLDALDDPWRGEFLADFTRRMAAAYPQREDGATLMPFKRLFIIAKR